MDGPLEEPSLPPFPRQLLDRLEQRGGSSGRPFRLHIPRVEENRLETVPLGTALKLETHLAQVARLASALTPEDPLWRELFTQPTELRHDVDGCSITYVIEGDERVIRVCGLQRAED